MACGDRYKHLIVTADGYTLDNLYGSFPFASDYTGWKLLADRMVELANDAFLRLGEIEGDRGVATHWNALQPLQNNLIGHWQELEDDWHQITLTQGTVEEINKAAQVCAEAICLLDRANAAIESYGAMPEVPGAPPGTDPGSDPTIPDVTPTPQNDRPGGANAPSGTPWWVGPMLGASAVIITSALAYGAWQKHKSRKRRQPPAARPEDAARARTQGRPVAQRPNPRSRSRSGRRATANKAVSHAV